MADDKLFRKAALDKLASPERLDVLMSVTKPADRTAKLTLLGLAIAGLAWAIFGTMPERISGQGQLRGGGGVQKIVAGGSGVLSSLSLKETGQVTAGDQIGVISTPAGDTGLEAALADLREAERLYGEARSTATGIIAGYESQRSIAQTQYAAEETQYLEKKKLVDETLLAPAVLRPHESAMRSLKQRMSELTIQITNENGKVQAAEARVRQAKINVEKNKTTQQIVAKVVSPLTGTVVRLAKQQGDPVTAGDVLAEIETKAEGAALEVVAYTPARLGRPMQPGHAAQITVAGIKREEYGFLKGTVTWVSPTPVSARDMAEVTKDSSGESAAYEVRVALTPDLNTDSQYAWSTADGPPQQLSGGIPTPQVDIEVGSRTPISLLIPYLRGMFGGG